MKKFTVKTTASLKDFTDCTYPQGSFVFRILLKKGDIRVNGVKVKENVKVNTGDEVTYYTNAAQESALSHNTVYEDENVLIADKHSGVTSEALFSELASYRPVHRLDRNTCGLIVLAKTAQAEEELLSAFKHRRVEKTYLCLAKNAFKEKNAVLTAYLKKDEGSASVRIYSSDKGGCAKIITEYKVLKNLGDIAETEVKLHTGKTHQIRAHLAFIGCPVLGDEKYGDRLLNAKYNARRQILIAKYLRFNLEGKLAYLNGKVYESSFKPNIKTAI